MRKMTSQIKQIQNMDEDELYAYAKVHVVGSFYVDFDAQNFAS